MMGAYDPDDGPSDPSSASRTDLARSEAGAVAGTASEQASSVAATAKAGGQQVATEAKEHVRDVAAQARDQAQSLLQQSQDEIRSQAGAQTERAAAGMRRMAEQLQALAEGRADEAGDMRNLVRQGSDRLSGYAGRLEQGGYQALLDDVRRFARRRPGLFLLSAAAAGFATGRLLRGAQAAHRDSDDGQGGQWSGQSGYVGTGYTGTGYTGTYAGTGYGGAGYPTTGTPTPITAGAGVVGAGGPVTPPAEAAWEAAPSYPGAPADEPVVTSGGASRRPGGGSVEGR